MTLRDIDIFLKRIGARIFQEYKIEASLHGIDLGGGSKENSEVPLAQLTPEKKAAMAEHLRKTQERLAGEKQGNG